MSNCLAGVNNQDVRDSLGYVTGGKAGLAEGTTANTIKTTIALDYAINHRWYPQKAATDNIAMNALATQAASTKCMYLVMIDTAGAVSLVKGTEVAAGGSAKLPDAPDGKAVVGAIKVETGAAATFTSGTTDLSAAGITATYIDLMRWVPDAF